MRMYGISDPVFSAFAGSNFVISDNNDVVTNILTDQTSQKYKDKFIEDVLSGNVLDNKSYKELTNNAYFFNRINSSIGYEKFKSNVIKVAEEYALPTAQIVGGGTQIIAATGIEVVGCGASYGTLCLPATGLAILLATDGSDNIATGLYNMGKKPEEQTVSFTLTQIYGLSESGANTVKMIAGTASMGGELGLAVNASRATNSVAATGNLTQVKAEEPVIVINITDVKNRLEDLENVAGAYQKISSHTTIDHNLSIDFLNSFTETGSTIRHNQYSTAIGDDVATVNNFNNVNNIKSGHNVIIHGMLNYDEIGGIPVLSRSVSVKVSGGRENIIESMPISIEQVAAAVKSNPDYKVGTPVCFGSCWSGSSGTAQQLVNELGVPVYAPTRPVRWDAGTESWVQDAEKRLGNSSIEAEWRMFYPKN